ncbi:TOPRIM nucleotidyl transferase/hydrolase domain-containing protein [Veronia nyctiphanis]|nr:TOPRIM nucleotidyl transferase/hydrolase domain-containing protein [Veronia nyctiphanis]
MSIEKCAQEQVLNELQRKAVIRKSSLAQRIYLLVEGELEEVTFPILLERAGIDYEKDNVVISNYKGINNLPHALRIIDQTNGHRYPIIVTHGNGLMMKALAGYYHKIPTASAT